MARHTPITAPSSASGVAPPSVAGWLLPVLVLLCGWSLSAWMFVVLQRAAGDREQEFFNERVAEAEVAIRARMTHYIDALHSGTSFFAASKVIDADEWRVYAESLQLQTRYPGINGLGIILAVAPDQVEAWKTQVRISGQPEPEIRRFPGSAEGPAEDVKYLITFVEGNLTDRRPIGRDIATDPSRRKAAERARDRGQPQINERIPGSRDTQRRSGLLLYVPLYTREAALDTVEQRRAAHLGWVYAQVFPDVFLDGVLGPTSKTLRLHFFESGGLIREKLLYSSEGETGAALPKFERVTEELLAGQPFQLGWQRGPQFPHPDKSAPTWVAASMAMATLLLAGLITSLQSVGRRANAIAAVRTAELAASEERFRHAFESAGVGMALVALDGRWLRVNAAMCEIVGYSEAKLLQKTSHDITHPSDVLADQALMRELIEGSRRFYQLEKRYIHREGHAVWIRLTASLARNAQGEPVHVIAQVEDITDRKRLEGSIASARDEALEASRLKSEFLAAMIGEIRTPTNDVIGLTRLLRDTPLTPVQAQYVRTVEGCGDALLAISNDILDYSKIAAGQIELEIAPFNLRACVDEAVEFFRERAAQKNIQLHATVAARVPSHAAGDVKRLRQILVNLLNNAIKVVDTGEVRVNLTAEALDPATGLQRLKFAVRDTDPAIRADNMEPIFTPFAQIDASTRRLGGTGLGLAISKRLSELMGGTMWVQREPGRGSTFHFTIVVEPLEEPASA